MTGNIFSGALARGVLFHSANYQVIQLCLSFSEIDRSFHDIDSMQFDPDTNPELNFGNISNISAISIDSIIGDEGRGIDSEKEKNGPCTSEKENQNNSSSAYEESWHSL